MNKKEDIPEEAVNADERLWTKLDSIDESLNKMAQAFTKFQENVEGRLNRIDEKYDELKTEQEHAKASREKIFVRIEKLEDTVKDQFHDLERRIDEVELAPARRALAKDDDNAGTIRREIIKKLTNLGIGVVLILILLFGSQLILKDFSAMVPKNIVEIIEEGTP